MEEDNQQQENHDDHDNQDHDHDQERGITSGVGGSRWNPTKEQIALLEKMYTDGVRTPSADQIQQITARLKAYGHIEGKNVFYWFQNHKARQRQKQRQQRLAAANSLHNPHHLINHHHHFLSPQHNYPPNHSINLNLNLNPNKTIFPAPPPPNYHPNHHHYLPNPNATAICNPYYYQLPQSNLGFYPVPPPYHHNSALEAGHRRLPTACNRASSGAMMISVNNATYHHDEKMGVRTLDLFPVHPTGILQQNKVGSTTSTYNSSSSSPSSSSVESDNVGNDEQQQRLFDFFSSDHASSESD